MGFFRSEATNKTQRKRKKTRMSSKRWKMFHYCYNLWSTIAIIWDGHIFNGHIIFIHFLTAMTSFNETPIFIDSSFDRELNMGEDELILLRRCCLQQSNIDPYQKEFGKRMQIIIIWMSEMRMRLTKCIQMNELNQNTKSLFGCMQRNSFTKHNRNNTLDPIQRWDMMHAAIRIEIIERWIV